MTPRELSALRVTIRYDAAREGVVIEGPREARLAVRDVIAPRTATLAPQLPATGPLPVLALASSQAPPAREGAWHQGRWAPGTWRVEPGAGSVKTWCCDHVATAGAWQACVTCGVDLGTPTRVRCDLCMAAVHKALARGHEVSP